MNLFYTNLDTRISKFNVYNVLTMGDDFMVVSGMPEDIGDQHVVEIANLALDLLASSVVFQVPHQPSAKLNIRMGFNSGPATGVVVGTKMPNYCVMSDTVDIAKEIQKHGEGMRILMSETSKRLIDKVGGFRCESRGPLDVKGQPPLETFWLVGLDTAN